MAQLPRPAASPLRARRWDTVVVGGALPGLVAAARLGQAGLRVLVVEEEKATRTWPPLREPFFLPGPGAKGVLPALLRELKIPLIDARRLEPDPLALQVVTPEARVDVEGVARTAEELVSWGLAKPEAALSLLRALARAAAAEGDAMLDSPVVRAGGLRRLSRATPPASRHDRGLPAEVANPPPELAPLLEALAQALGGIAGTGLGPESRARLLGSALQGAVAFPTPEHTLRGLLRERVRALHGELRSVAGPFALVAADGDPGLAPARSGEAWLGRALVLNAPRGLVARVSRELDPSLPDALDAPPPRRRRLSVHLRARADLLPEGMGRRVVHVGDPRAPLAGTNPITLSVHPPARSSDAVDLVAAAVVDAEDPDPEARAAELVRAVESLLPFSQGRLARHEVPRPRWDDDAAVEDSGRGGAWPGEVEVRALARPPVWDLPRSALGGLGVEGDLLLGWRAGDRIAADLGARPGPSF